MMTRMVTMASENIGVQYDVQGIMSSGYSHTEYASTAKEAERIARKFETEYAYKEVIVEQVYYRKEVWTFAGQERVNWTAISRRTIKR